MKHISAALIGLAMTSAASAGFITLDHIVSADLSTVAFSAHWDVSTGSPDRTEFARPDLALFSLESENGHIRATNYLAPGPPDSGSISFSLRLGPLISAIDDYPHWQKDWVIPAGEYSAFASIVVFSWDAALGCANWYCNGANRDMLETYTLSDSVRFSIGAPVPTPSTLALLGLGLAGLVAMRRKS